MYKKKEPQEMARLFRGEVTETSTRTDFEPFFSPDITHHAAGLSSCHESIETQPSPLVNTPTATMSLSQ